jgi:hypothetical protein
VTVDDEPAAQCRRYEDVEKTLVLLTQAEMHFPDGE